MDNFITFNTTYIWNIRKATLEAWDIMRNIRRKTAFSFLTGRYKKNKKIADEIFIGSLQNT